MTVPNAITTPLEWKDKIDMRARTDSKWQIETFFNARDMTTFGQHMINKDLFDVFRLETKPFADKSGRYFVFLTMVPDAKQSALVSTRRLTRVIKDCGGRIYWKEKGMGYLIDEHGHIRRKWKLNSSK